MYEKSDHNDSTINDDFRRYYTASKAARYFWKKYRDSVPASDHNYCETTFTQETHKFGNVTIGRCTCRRDKDYCNVNNTVKCACRLQKRNSNLDFAASTYTQSFSASSSQTLFLHSPTTSATYSEVDKNPSRKEHCRSSSKDAVRIKSKLNVHITPEHCVFSKADIVYSRPKGNESPNVNIQKQVYLVEQSNTEHDSFSNEKTHMSNALSLIRLAYASEFDTQTTMANQKRVCSNKKHQQKSKRKNKLSFIPDEYYEKIMHHSTKVDSSTLTVFKSSLAFLSQKTKSFISSIASLTTKNNCPFDAESPQEYEEWLVNNLGVNATCNLIKVCDEKRRGISDREECNPYKQKTVQFCSNNNLQNMWHKKATSDVHVKQKTRNPRRIPSKQFMERHYPKNVLFSTSSTSTQYNNQSIELTHNKNGVEYISRRIQVEKNFSDSDNTYKYEKNVQTLAFSALSNDKRDSKPRKKKKTKHHKEENAVALLPGANHFLFRFLYNCFVGIYMFCYKYPYTFFVRNVLIF